MSLGPVPGWYPTITMFICKFWCISRNCPGWSVVNDGVAARVTPFGKIKRKIRVVRVESVGSLFMAKFAPNID
jgi:hypothetical protein